MAWKRTESEKGDGKGSRVSIARSSPFISIHLRCAIYPPSSSLVYFRTDRLIISMALVLDDSSRKNLSRLDIERETIQTCLALFRYLDLPFTFALNPSR